MKKMLKGISIILIIASALILLTGCGKEKEETSKTTPNENVNVKNNVEEQKNNSTEKFPKGEWNNGVYENKFLGLKFKLPDGWKYSSDEEIAKICEIKGCSSCEIKKENATNGIINKTRYSRLLESHFSLENVLKFLQANDLTTNNNVQGFTEKVPTGISEEAYLEQVSKQLSALENVNYNIGEIAKEKVTNKEYTTLQVEVPEYNVLQKYFIYKKDNYIVGIIVTSITGKTAISEIIENFE